MGFWGKFAKGFDIVTDVAGATGIPPLMAIDAAKETIKAVAGKSAEDDHNLREAAGALEVVGAGLTKLQDEHAAAILEVTDLAARLRTMELQPKGRLEHKRLKTAIVGGVSVVAIYFGFPEEIADQLALTVSALAGSFILGDSVRPSGAIRSQQKRHHSG